MVRLHASTAGGMSLIPCPWGKICMPHGMAKKKKKRKKSSRCLKRFSDELIGHLVGQWQHQNLHPVHTPGPTLVCRGGGGSKQAQRCSVTFEATHAHRSSGSQLPFITLGARQSWGPSPLADLGDKKVLGPRLRTEGALSDHALSGSTMHLPVASVS